MDNMIKKGGVVKGQKDHNLFEFSHHLMNISKQIKTKCVDELATIISKKKAFSTWVEKR